MGALALLSALLEPKSVKVDANQCLNRRHKDAACRLCADECPADAISLGAFTGIAGAASSTLAVDADTCRRCGICQAACPTGVFAVPEVTLIPALAKLRSPAAPVSMTGPAGSARPAAPVLTTPALTCDRTGGHQTGGIPCLAALTWEDLAVLALSGPGIVRLLDAGCSNCTYGAHGAAGLIDKQVAAANHFLTAWGVDGAQVVLTDDPGDPGVPEAPVATATPGTAETISRRDLFAFWRHRGTAVLAESLPELTWLDPPPAPGLPQALPQSRRRLLNLLKQQGLPVRGGAAAAPVAPDSLPLTSWTVSLSCDGCGLCATLCPTEALQLEDQDGVRSLTFQPATCVDCGLCLRTCPQQALAREPLTSLEPLLTAARETLWTAPQHQCPRCGQGHTHPEALCSSCRKSHDLLADVRRQLLGL
ncbi:MAG: 4Fe-4S dicluster domain-containing protein [Symbiobacteriia bacterium]